MQMLAFSSNPSRGRSQNCKAIPKSGGYHYDYLPKARTVLGPRGNDYPGSKLLDHPPGDQTSMLRPYRGSKITPEQNTVCILPGDDNFNPCLNLAYTGQKNMIG